MKLPELKIGDTITAYFLETTKKPYWFFWTVEYEEIMVVVYDITAVSDDGSKFKYNYTFGPPYFGQGSGMDSIKNLEKDLSENCRSFVVNRFGDIIYEKFPEVVQDYISEMSKKYGAA